MLTMPYRPMSWEASTGSAGEQVRFAVSECWLMQRVALSRLSLPGRCGGNPAKCYWLGKFRRDGIAAATLKRAECCKPFLSSPGLSRRRGGSRAFRLRAPPVVRPLDPSDGFSFDNDLHLAIRKPDSSVGFPKLHPRSSIPTLR
jgi:hypothetical protein